MKEMSDNGASEEEIAEMMNKMEAMSYKEMKEMMHKEGIKYEMKDMEEDLEVYDEDDDLEEDNHTVPAELKEERV